MSNLEKIFSRPVEMVWSASPGKAAAFPPERLPEVAFIGRSNVGKSTLTNAVLGRKNIARTSRTPGRTRTVLFYEVADLFNLVDLPGYGFAKMSATEARALRRLVGDYLGGRRGLKRVYVLLDARHGLKESDKETLSGLLEEGIPATVLLTKADKLRGKAVELAVEKVAAELAKIGGFPTPLPVSPINGLGIAELRRDVLKNCGILEAS